MLGRHAHPKGIQIRNKSGRCLWFRIRNQPVKAVAERFFLGPFAIVPGTALQTHREGIIADEMRLHARLEEPPIGFIRA